MGLFEHFPYSNYHDMNLDWIIKKMNDFVDYIAEKEEEWQEMQADWDQIQADFAQIQADFAQIQLDVAAAIDGIAPAIADGLREAEAAMQAQYDAFIQQYQETWNIVQTRGQSTTDVMSQKAVSDEIADLELEKLDAANVKQTTGEATNLVMSQKAVTDQLALKASAADVEALETAVAAKVAKADIRQTTGSGEDLVMSQKAVSDALDAKLNANAVKQATGSNTGYVMSQKATTDALALKIDKASIRQSTGQGEDLVMSQEAITEALALKGDASDVGTLQTQMAAVQVAVASKASQDSLDALATIVGALSNNAVEVYPTAVSHGNVPWSGITFTAMPANKYYTFSTDITDQDIAWLPGYGTICTIIRFAAYALAYQNGKLYYCATAQDPSWKQIVNTTDLNTALNLKLDKSAVKQVLGSSTTDVISQALANTIYSETLFRDDTEITHDTLPTWATAPNNMDENIVFTFDNTVLSTDMAWLPAGLTGNTFHMIRVMDSVIAWAEGKMFTLEDISAYTEASDWKQIVYTGDITTLPVIIDCTSGSLPSGWTFAAIDAIIDTRPVFAVYMSAVGQIAQMGQLFRTSSNTFMTNTVVASSSNMGYQRLTINADSTLAVAYLLYPNVTANPTLAGTEAALEGLQVGGTKYSNKLYRHCLSIVESGVYSARYVFISRSATDVNTVAGLYDILDTYIDQATGWYISGSTLYNIIGIRQASSNVVQLFAKTVSGEETVNIANATITDHVKAI